MTAPAEKPHDRTPVMNFIDNGLDRQAIRRGDADWIKSRLSSSDTEVVLSTANRLVLPAGNPSQVGLPLGRAVELGADLEEMIFLGQDSGGNRPLFAATTPQTDEDLETLDDVRVIDLRTLALEADYSREDLSALAQARALIHWHRTHQFCSRCGHKTALAEAGYRRDCPSCDGQHFPRTDPCVIMLITDGDRALLGRPPRLAEGMFTTLAGFMEPGETIEQAVRRETFEEAGIRVGDVRLVSNQPWPFPANLMLGCHGEALSSEISIGDDELESCRWCDRTEVRQMVDGTHPQGHRIPPAISIAYELITGWLDKAE